MEFWNKHNIYTSSSFRYLACNESRVTSKAANEAYPEFMGFTFHKTCFDSFSSFLKRNVREKLRELGDLIRRMLEN